MAAEQNAPDKKAASSEFANRHSLKKQIGGYGSSKVAEVENGSNPGIALSSKAEICDEAVGGGVLNHGC
jgi:hypothetical protein